MHYRDKPVEQPTKVPIDLLLDAVALKDGHYVLAVFGDKDSKINDSLKDNYRQVKWCCETETFYYEE